MISAKSFLFAFFITRRPHVDIITFQTKNRKKRRELNLHQSITFLSFELQKIKKQINLKTNIILLNVWQREQRNYIIQYRFCHFGHKFEIVRTFRSQSFFKRKKDQFRNILRIIILNFLCGRSRFIRDLWICTEVQLVHISKYI